MAKTTSRRTALPPGTILRFCLALLAVVAAAGAVGDETSDPFATGKLVPARPGFSPGSPADGSQQPCPLPAANTRYGALEVVDLALCRNPGTREVWASARVAAEQVGLAQADFLPAVDGGLSIGRQRSDGHNVSTRAASLTLSWLLFDFGARSAKLEGARQLLAAAAASLDSTVQGVFFAALRAYYGAQAARAALAAALESERASRASLSAAEVRYQVGSGTPADRLQAQTAWSQATLNRIKAEGALRNAYGRLANVMGLDAHSSLTLDEIALTPPALSFENDVAALIAEARRNRPDLQAAEAELRAAQANVDYARAASRPTIALHAGPSWQEVDGLSTRSTTLGLSLTLPIFTGYASTYGVRSAQAKSEVQAARREGIRQQVALDVWEAYQALATATQTVRTAADLLASAEQSERVAAGRYQAGVGNILDLLNAQSALANARLQRIQAMLDWHVSRAALAHAIGTLDHRLLAAQSSGAFDRP